MTAQRPAAVLWDMDGTIVDTEPLWIDAQRGLLDDFGLPQLDAAGEEALIGANLTDAALLFRRLGVPLEPAQIVERVSGEVTRRLTTELAWRPGARELLADLVAHGVPLGLVTNSPRSMALHIIAGLPAGTFDVVVGADDVTHGKPHPQPYLLAAERLGVAPAGCVVIEDSLHGLRSGTAAGMTTIGIPHAATLTPDDATVLLPSLLGIDGDEFFRRVREAA